MGAFNLIETFFFLTLGITFGLIVLLVYHFKKRISTIEQKSDTMLDIVQNLAKEVITLKHEYANNQTQSTQPSTFPFVASGYNPFMGNMDMGNMDIGNMDIGNMNVSNMMNMDNMMNMSSVIFEVNDTRIRTNNENKENKVEEIDDDDDAEDEDEDDEDDEDDDDDDDSSDDSEDDDSSDTDDIDVSIKVEPSNTKIVVMDDIKIININEKINFSEIQEIDEEPLEMVQEMCQEMAQEMIEITEPEQILVNKLNETESKEIDKIENHPIQNLNEIYHKMSVNELKKTVISKGLGSNVSKLKRDDLLKLLLDK